MELLLLRKSNNNVTVVGMQIPLTNSSLELIETHVVSSCKLPAHSSCACDSDMGIILAGGEPERAYKERAKECHSFRVRRKPMELISTTQQPMHGDRDATAAACFFPPSLIFVTGGTKEGRTTEVFHGGLNRWVSLISLLPSPRTNHRLVASGDSVYCLGGKTTNVTNTCLRMSLSNAADDQENAQFDFPEMVEKLAWEQIDPMIYKRQSFGVLARADYILVFGGSTGSRVRADIETYSLQEMTWRKLGKSMLFARENPSVIVLEDLSDPVVLILGGVDAEEKPVPEIEAISLNNLTDPESPIGFRVIGTLKDGETQDQYFPLRYEVLEWEREEWNDPLIFESTPDSLSRFSTTDGSESNVKGVPHSKYYKVVQMLKIVLGHSAIPTMGGGRDTFGRKDPYDFYVS